MPKCGTIKLCGSNVASRTGGGGRGGLSDTPNNLNILVGNLKEKTQLERHKLECDGNIKVYSNVREMENKNYLNGLRVRPRYVRCYVRGSYFLEEGWSVDKRSDRAGYKLIPLPKKKPWSWGLVQLVVVPTREK